jgi:hypothetical protein
VSGREVDSSVSSSAEVKNEWSYTSTPHICLNGMDRDKFTFYSTFDNTESRSVEPLKYER